MQTEITQTIIQKVPMLSEDDQKKVLENIENLLNGERQTLSSVETETAWARLKKAVAENRVNSGLGDLAEQHDHYIYGTEKTK